MSEKYTLSIYLDTGVVFEYDVLTKESVREHASAIVMGGYCRVSPEGRFEHYGPHRILKVTSTGMDTMYPDRVRST